MAERTCGPEPMTLCWGLYSQLEADLVVGCVGSGALGYRCSKQQVCPASSTCRQGKICPVKQNFTSGTQCCVCQPGSSPPMEAISTFATPTRETSTRKPSYHPKNSKTGGKTLPGEARAIPSSHVPQGTCSLNRAGWIAATYVVVLCSCTPYIKHVYCVSPPPQPEALRANSALQ